MRPFTEKLRDDSGTFQSSYGLVTNREWCRREIERLNKEYGRVCFFLKDKSEPGESEKPMVCIMTTLKKEEDSEDVLLAKGWKIK